MICAQCQGIEEVFSKKQAKKDLKKYRKKRTPKNDPPFAAAL